MAIEFWIWLLIMFLLVGMLYINVNNILAFDELQNDHKNPTDVCNSLNPVSCWIVHKLYQSLLYALSHDILYFLSVI